MAFVTIVVSIALIQYFVFAALVGFARSKYKVPAPATTGHEMFERYYRVHQNTLESLPYLIPSIYTYAYFGNPNIAGGLGCVYLVGRTLYLFSYVKNPNSRSLGYLLTILPCFVLIGGSVIGAFSSL